MAASKKPGVMRWLGSAVRNLIDQATEERVEPHVAWMEAQIVRLKMDFSYAAAAEARRLSRGDRDLVARLVYRRFLDRCWKDARLTATESELLGWLAGNLGIPRAMIEQFNVEAAAEVFGVALAKAFDDGRIDDEERERLEQIAASAGETTGSLMSRFFEQEGEQFVRSLFAEIASTGRLTREAWKHFRETAEWVGLPKDRMLQAIRQPAKQLVEHTLTDARIDGEISEKEERVIDSLLENIIEDEAFRAYVRGEIAEAKEEQNLARGLLPSIAAPKAVALRAGEIVHWAGPVTFVRERELASGLRVDSAIGTLVITDSRTIFNSTERSAEVNHRKVLAHHTFGPTIEIRSPGKGAGRYEFPRGSRAVAIWETAIGRANRTIVASDDRESRRRIPRDVRQRVWQKYGGRCAECDADTYLEFDHIIPVAKGGGNSDTNVQLLCRKCNLAKSDRI